MAPIEVTFLTIVVIVALIGLARGYRRELGSTLIILVALFLLTFLGERIEGGLGQANALLFDGGGPTGLVLALFFQILFITFVFWGYAGQTLDFAGTEAPPPTGTLISLAVGALNGYLIAGTLWYFLALYDYPYAFRQPLTETGEAFVALLPPALFDQPAYWIVPVAILLLLRVRG